MTKNIMSLLEELSQYSSEKYKSNIIKLGIPEKETIGVSTACLRKIATRLKKDNANKEFIKALWETNYHEAKILGTLLMKTIEYSPDEIDWFMSRIVSWDLCDLFCKTNLIHSKHFNFYIHKWVTMNDLYYKRAAFTLIASMSTHSVINHKEISDYLLLCKNYSNDERLHLKKAISWAIRELGKIDIPAKEMSIEIAHDLTKSDIKSKIWIGKDALKELVLLVSVPERSRLISKKSKMGKSSFETNN